MTNSKNFGERVVEFNRKLHYKGNLPKGFDVLNPFLDNPETLVVMNEFYCKFYNDNLKRKFIIGINPSRHGAGLTGVPFTDTKRLDTVCGIKMHSAYSHEPSSVFMYEVIDAFGGPEKFYKTFYINSPFPLAIIRQSENNRWLNANYYDDKQLIKDTTPFMIESLKNHISLGIDTKEVFILGKKNADCIKKINNQEHFFEKLTVLEHPRYIQQYKSKEKEKFIAKYLEAFSGNENLL